MDQRRGNYWRTETDDKGNVYHSWVSQPSIDHFNASNSGTGTIAVHNTSRTDPGSLFNPNRGSLSSAHTPQHNRVAPASEVLTTTSFSTRSENASGQQHLPSVHLQKANHAPASETQAQCRFFLKGRCRYGNRCKFSHGVPSRDPTTRIARDDCYAWKTGYCINGDACNHARWHDPKARAAEFVRVRKIAVEETNRTIAHTISASTVTFAAGASVVRIVTGFESCRVSVTNLPSSATMADIEALFSQPGFTGFNVTVLRPSDDGLQEAIVVFSSAHTAELAVAGLDGVEFEEEILEMEIIPKVDRTLGSMMREYNTTITITWTVPSMWVEFQAERSREFDLERKALELDGSLLAGRRVRAFFRPKRLHLVPASMVVTGVPANISNASLWRLVGFDPVLKSASLFNDQEGLLERLGRCLYQLSDGLIDLKKYESSADEESVSAVANYASWEEAKTAYDQLDPTLRQFFGDWEYSVDIHPQYSYWKSCPDRQYEVQEDAISAIKDGIDPTSDISIMAFETSAAASDDVRVELSGSDYKAVGALKVRIEKLMAGEIFPCTEPFFSSTHGKTFLERVYGIASVYVRVDERLKSLRLFGDPAGIAKAKEMIMAMIDALSPPPEFSIPLKPTSVGFFVRHGIQVLTELVGENNVRLDRDPRGRITIRGDEEAKHMLRMLVEQSLMDHFHKPGPDVTCPICFSDIEAPFRLFCGHSYCNSCLRRFFATAVDTKKFPLVCMGNEGTCRRPFPIPTIQKFLPPPQLKRLLETSFSDYLDRHPEDFKYCSTPDCPQIYRVEEGKDFVGCPSCLAIVCVSCQEDHEPFDCEEWRIHQSSEMQEWLLNWWAERNGVKKCPNCAVWIEKSDGCNHMECTKCKSHICWVCMMLFRTSEEVYPHMTDTHGGIGV